jgi:hypothetical protein
MGGRGSFPGDPVYGLESRVRAAAEIHAAAISGRIAAAGAVNAVAASNAAP